MSMKGKDRMEKVDSVLQVGTKTMRQVATEQQSLFEDLYGGDNMYSDTDDDDDYTESEEEEDEEEDDEEDEEEEGSDRGSATPSSSRKASTKGHISFDENDPTDPFNQLELMQQHRTNALGQTMGETHAGDPLQAYLSEPALHAIPREFRKEAEDERHGQGGAQEPYRDGQPYELRGVDHEAEKQSDSTQRRLNAGKLSNTEQSILYIEQIKKYRRSATRSS